MRSQNSSKAAVASLPYREALLIAASSSGNIWQGSSGHGRDTAVSLILESTRDMQGELTDEQDKK